MRSTQHHSSKPAAAERLSPGRAAWIVAPMLVLLGVIVSAAGATIFVLPSDAELAEQSPVIVEGRILSVHSGSGPALEYRLLTRQVLKGQPPETLRIRVPGGPSDGGWWSVAGAPRFVPGEDVLLFLVPRDDGSWGLSQLLLGAFRRVESAEGSLVVRDLAGAHELRLADRPAVSDGPRDLKRFRAWLADRSRGIQRREDYFVPWSGVDQTQVDGHATKAGDNGFQTIVSTNDPPPIGCGAEGGHSVRWFDFDAGGQVSWRAYFSGQPGLESFGIDELETALAAWSGAGGLPIELGLDGLTSADRGLTAIDGTNTVLFGDPNDEIGGSWIGSGVLALGGPWFRCDLVEFQGVEHHPVVEGDIILQDGLASFFASNPAASAAAEELFAHELGHTLGLAHSLDPEALMYSELHDDGRGALLSADDLAGLEFLYGAGSQTLPEAPSDLVATALGPHRVELAWNDRSDDENGFRIERRRLAGPGGGDSPGAFEIIGTAARNGESWSDGGAEPETTYGYRVRAQNSAGGSPYTPEAVVTTPEQQVPAGPSHLRVAALSSESLRLTWQDNSDSELGYRIEILVGSQGEFFEIPFLLASDTRSAILSGLEPDQSYSVRVRAFNVVGSSVASNTVTIKTFPVDATCEITSDTLCLLGGRFSLRLEYRNQHDGGSEGQARVLPDSDQTGFFWFFDPSRLEVVAKMVDGRGLNGHFWLYVGGLTDLEYTLTVTDTLTGRSRSLENPPGTVCGQADIELFDDPDAVGLGPSSAPRAEGEAPIEPSRLFVEPVSPLGKGSGRSVLASRSSGDCDPGPTTLCLLDRRLSVEVAWDNPYVEGVSGQGQVIEGSEGSGMFWFFDPRNIELIVKAVDGTTANGHLWLFFGALSDVEYRVDVTDTLTGNTRTYYNPPGNLCGRADIEALPSPTVPGGP